MRLIMLFLVVATISAFWQASEYGDWIERWTDKDGVTELRGTYLTMWKRDGGHWREHSETIVPETCAGSSSCRQR